MKLPEITIIYGPKEGLGGEQRKRATVRPNREFWRYLLAGLAGLLEAAGVVAAEAEAAGRGKRACQYNTTEGALRYAQERLLILANPAQTRLDGGEEPAAAGAKELMTRVLIVLQAHLQAREAFFKEERGVYHPPTAAAQEEARKEIRAALVRHHETNGDREKWRKESAVIAAGIGIFYSEPHNGELERSRAQKQQGSKPLPGSYLPKIYLELWRPWKLQRGKPDPVPGFAELCFERRRESDGK